MLCHPYQNRCSTSAPYHPINQYSPLFDSFIKWILICENKNKKKNPLMRRLAIDEKELKLTMKMKRNALYQSIVLVTIY